MKIECILKREGGSVVDLGGIEYHFEPLADGAHVADVEDKAHIDRFLSISEGYKLYHGKDEPKGQPKQIGELQPVNVPAPAGTKPVGALAGSDELPPQFDINGKTVTQLEAVNIAFAASGLTSDEWNELDKSERTAKIEIALDELAEAGEGNEGDELDLDALKAAYKERFGKAAHHTWTAEVIAEKLKAE